MRIASLNVQNLRLMPGDTLFGARNRDDEEDPALDAADRRLTAQVLGRANADIVALQEVFDENSLDVFHDRVLTRVTAPYPWRLCLPGNDGRGLDVAVMSRRPWDKAISHADLTCADLGLIPPEGMDPAQPVFRRDCLELHFDALTLFVVHFKAPTPDAAKAWAVRRLEAQAVAHLAAGAGPLWLVAGDLNEPLGDKRAVAPLEALGENLMQRLPEADRWTYFHPTTQRCDTPDGLIASHALAERLTDRRPEVVRVGLGLESDLLSASRLSGVGVHRPHASDHAAVVMDLEGL
ncbi:endonuclease/exonuclease/phosphatase family protein [Antarctobacter sp.]|uniref:endonuclease/exonuclease/phosphatase family protein n=1 Tax=Antarctobacter sp. TaxID=1872577 RepID=UPI002B276F16|nr:endonuclease/exonuclease/phosphatase family protein [Antarctobacter sp.]